MSSENICVGDWVVAGHGDEVDLGHIVALDCGKDEMAEGDAIGGEVAWVWSQTRSHCPVGGQNDVDVFARRSDAEDEAKRRRDECNCSRCVAARDRREADE